MKNDSFFKTSLKKLNSTLIANFKFMFLKNF